MCILSYIPTRVGFTITFSRDEVYKRASTAPELHNYNGQQLVFPKDISSGGSWIGLNKTKSILGCILNNTGKDHHSNRLGWLGSEKTKYFDVLSLSHLFQ